MSENADGASTRDWGWGVTTARPSRLCPCPPLPARARGQRKGGVEHVVGRAIWKDREHGGPGTARGGPGTELGTGAPRAQGREGSRVPGGFSSC